MIGIKVLRLHSLSKCNNKILILLRGATKKKVIIAGGSAGCCSAAYFWNLLAAICICAVWLNAQLCQAAPSATIDTANTTAAAAANETAWPPMHHYDIWSADWKTPTAEQQLELFEEEEKPGQEQLLLQDANSYSTNLGQSSNSSDWNSHQTSSNRRRSKVLHIFPVPVDGECLSDDGRRLGNCFNAYECRKKGGQAKGECAMGFGVCCVFVATCNGTISNNLTYIVSPAFPSFMPSNFTGCQLRVKLMSEEISQLRLDFNHFSLGQPNRRTGVCDGDIFNISGGPSGNFTLCGQNNGQHLYYDVGVRPLPRQSVLYGSLRPPISSNTSSTNGNFVDQLINININLSTRFLPIRLWEIRLSQIPFSQRAPTGCLQYHSGVEGIMQTFNFADNGRHLANQHYRICVRQETDMCSIMYQPCDEQSFRIGGAGFMNSNTMSSNGGSSPNAGQAQQSTLTAATSGSTMTTMTQQLMQFVSTDASTAATTITTTTAPPTTTTATTTTTTTTTRATTTTARSSSTEATTTTTPTPAVEEETWPADEEENWPAADEASTSTTQSPPANDDAEGSGWEDDNKILGFFGTTALPGVSRRPRPVGGGGGGVRPSGGFDLFGFLRSAFDMRLRQQRSRRQARQFFSNCRDRITMPCIIEDFIGTGLGPLPGCEPVHCGAQFCSSGVWPCRIESTVTPFYIGVHFGDGAAPGKGSAEDNIGACLRYNQVQCI
ncbi:uncharacterized protein LOC6566711 [Drosophila grimshawi]|uniref:GH13822 n=1 Tax=Drosophila grimshawi TaxID=7222 RepID=B4JR53_DROGR|nr:uncharacterized protein LOC6566711 [Drosophila grimshawi]EDV99383.1 GH13822 [Drosophila grimshawi]